MKVGGRVSTVLIFGLFQSLANGQDLERDYSKYLQPLIFVLPEAPPATDATQLRKYSVKIDIKPDGSVRLPVEVEPSEPFMRSAVNDAARFWLFAPGLTGDCKPGPRSGKVSLEYDTGKGQAWIELPGIEENPLRKHPYDIVKRGDNAYYPKNELYKGIDGTVTVAMKLMPNGLSAEHTIYIAIPPAKGFQTSALYGAKMIEVKFKEAIDKDFICGLTTYKFTIQ